MSSCISGSENTSICLDISVSQNRSPVSGYFGLFAMLSFSTNPVLILQFVLAGYGSVSVEFASFQTLSSLFGPALSFQCKPLFLDLNSQGL